MAGLGDLVVRLAADVATFQRDLGRAAHMADKFGRDVNRALSLVGTGIGVGLFTKFIKDTIDAADRLNDLRTRTGLTGQELLVLEGAAVRSGVGITEVGDVVSKLTRRLGEAQKGTGDAAAAYQALGISVTDAAGNLKSTERILGELGAKFSEFEDGTNKGLLAISALGKGGDRLIPMLEALEETRQRFKRLGVTIDEDLITAADRFNDKIQDLASVNQVLGRQIAAALLPHLEKFVDLLIELTQKSNAFEIAVRAVIIPLKVFAAGFITIGTAAAAAGDIVAGFAALISGRMAQQLKAYSDYLEGLQNFDLSKTFDAAKRLMSLDFGSGVESWNEAVGRAKSRVDGLASAVRKLDVFGSGQAGSSLWGDEERGRRRQAPRLPDLAANKATDDALRKLLDQRAKLELELLKDLASKREALLDAGYQANLVGEQEYWTQKMAILRGSLDAELRVLDDQISRQQTAVSRAGKGSKDYYNALGDLEESQAKRNKLERDFQQAAGLGYYAAQAAADQYRRSIEDLNAQILELKGNTAEAAAIRFQLANEDLRRKLTANNDQGGLARLGELERLTAQQAQFNQLLEQQSIAYGKIQLEEQRLQNLVNAGAISEIDLLNRKSEINKRAVAAYQEQLRALEALTDPTERQKLQIAQLRVEIEGLSMQTTLLAQKFDGVISDSFADAFSDFISRTKSAKEAFASFASSVVQQINRMVAESLSKQLFNALGMGPGSGNSPGGWLAGLLGGLLSGPSAYMNNVIPSTGPFPNIPIPGFSFPIPSAAVGMEYVPKDMLVNVHKGEAIIPAAENTGGRGMSVTNVFNISGGMDRRSREQVAVAAGRGLQRAMARDS